MKTTHTSGQLAKILQILESKGVTPDIVQSRIESGALADFFDPAARFERPTFRAAISLPGLGIEAFPGATLTSMGIIEVNYAAIAAPGGYEAMLRGGHDGDNRNSDITVDRFPVSGDGAARLETAILHLGCDKSSEAVVSAAAAIDEANPWRVAGIAPLCALGAKKTDEQRKHWIVGLGSVGQVDGDRRVPVLGGGGAGRDLYPLGWGLDWNGRYRFLLVRNASASAPQA